MSSARSMPASPPVPDISSELVRRLLTVSSGKQQKMELKQHNTSGRNARQSSKLSEPGFAVPPDKGRQHSSKLLCMCWMTVLNCGIKNGTFSKSECTILVTVSRCVSP
eukprot:6462655-Amphidinium_carterae.1